MIWVLLIVAAVAIIYFKVRKSDSFSYSSSSSAGSTNTSSNTPKQIQPYPMQSGAMNAAIGAVDKCCEFAAFCEKYVIPAGVCSPEQLHGYIGVMANTIGFGFTWKTFYYSLDSLIEKQGYSICNGGFSFSENSGMVSYQRQIQKDEVEYEAAYAWIIETPIEEIIKYFEKVAENNFTSLGINSHSASCWCTRSEGNERCFEFTV